MTKKSVNPANLSGFWREIRIQPHLSGLGLIQWEPGQNFRWFRPDLPKLEPIYPLLPIYRCPGFHQLQKGQKSNPIQPMPLKCGWIQNSLLKPLKLAGFGDIFWLHLFFCWLAADLTLNPSTFSWANTGHNGCSNTISCSLCNLFESPINFTFLLKYNQTQRYNWML